MCLITAVPLWILLLIDRHWNNCSKGRVKIHSRNLFMNMSFCFPSRISISFQMLEATHVLSCLCVRFLSKTLCILGKFKDSFKIFSGSYPYLNKDCCAGEGLAKIPLPFCSKECSKEPYFCTLIMVIIRR